MPRELSESRTDTEVEQLREELRRHQDYLGDKLRNMNTMLHRFNNSKHSYNN
uniref:Uncharacterized protein n=1 Tax=Zea mays TaxID=4577 RepID=B4FV39_MAIZE|nr:unknown [Zea mays]